MENTYWSQINSVIDFLKKTSDYMGYIGSFSGSLDEYKEYGSNFKTSKKLKIYSSSFYGNQYTKVYAIGKKLKRIGQVGNTLSVLCSAAKTITSQSQNRGQIAMKEAGSVVGSWTGGTVGMKLVASCGIYFGPYGAIVGGVTCGIIGGIIGEEASRSYFNDIYIEYGD